jgi:uncharacterized OsmC-like protein
MHQMKVSYQGDLRTEAVHLDSRSTIHTDAPKDNQGKGEAFSPTDLMSTSLASCMLTIMAMKARALGLEFPAVTVEVQKVMRPSPRMVAEIVLRFDWQGLDQRISPEALLALKEAGLNCPVALSLAPEVKKTLLW